LKEMTNIKSGERKMIFFFKTKLAAHVLYNITVCPAHNMPLF